MQELETMAINRVLTRRLAECSEPIGEDMAAEILVAHHRFLSAGGAEGRWQCLVSAGLPMAIYRGDAPRGEQACLQLSRVPDSYQGGVSLPWANLAGALGERMDFRLSYFTGSMFADGHFAGADFSSSILCDADFSRADLRNCRFVQARLDNADFTGADLRGADFTDAYLEGARFSDALVYGATGLVEYC